MAKPDLNELRRTIKAPPSNNSKSQEDADGLTWGVVIILIIFCLLII